MSEYNLEDFAREGRLAVETESDPDEGYLMMLGVKFNPDQADQAMEFYRQFGDHLQDEGLTVYGNSGSAVEATLEKDSLGVYRTGEWAIDVSKILDKIDETRAYRDTIKALSAATFRAVTRSQDPELDTEDYGFYREILQELEEPVDPGSGEEGPIHIPVEEEPQLDYEELVSGTVDESKARIRELESEQELREKDYRKMLEAEDQKEESRITLKRFIETKLEESR